MSAPRRPSGRAPDALRPLRLETGVQKFAEGSALVEFGATRVLVTATVENRVPPFLAGKGRGWVTAEYAMLPRATPTRSARESSRGRPAGRSQEIQRLIGRSLRAAVDLQALGERTVTLDCDVLQADGGTRTASITGAWTALVHGLAPVFLAGDLDRWPILHQVAAVSVGVVGDEPRLDLEYVEDAAAAVDLNVVATEGDRLIEIQGTGEERPFLRSELDRLVDLALGGIRTLTELQLETLREPLAEVREVVEHGRRRAEPRSEDQLWGRPEH